MKSILICLEKMGIGGVETSVVNQTINLINLGYNVVILAESGIYTEKLENIGAKCIDFKFELENNFNLEKANEIVKIIDQYDIDEIQVNQFPCILSVLPAALISKTPYCAYIHTGVTGVYDWYCNTFSIYNQAFKMFFENAYKIIAITNEAKQEVISKFNICEKKVDIINNSIDFDTIDKIEQIDIKEIKEFLIISRLSNEKIVSIKNAIDLYTYYSKKSEYTHLNIIGDGQAKEEIEEYIKQNEFQSRIEMLGAKNDVLEHIAKTDVVIGVDRCMLEAISMKKVAIISGYKSLKQIVTNENINIASKENFSGHNLPDSSVEDIVKKLNDLSKENFIEILESNYKYAFNNLNIKNNFYIIDKKKKELSDTNKDGESYIVIFEGIIKLQEKNIEYEKLIQEYENNKEDKRVIEKNEKIRQLEKELLEVYNSKRWKYTDKISKIFK